MTQLVVTIGGLPNAGKSTVSRMLAELLPDTVRIELDGTGIGHTAGTLTNEERQALRDRDINIEIEDATTVAANWIERNFDVILVGLFNDGASASVRQMLDRRFDSLRYLCVGLNPSLETVLGPRGSRVPDDNDQRYARSIANWYEPNGVLIDNAGQSHEETVKAIAHLMREAKR